MIIAYFLGNLQSWFLSIFEYFLFYHSQIVPTKFALNSFNFQKNCPTYSQEQYYENIMNIVWL
jgi:hypothetical protein